MRQVNRHCYSISQKSTFWRDLIFQRFSLQLAEASSKDYEFLIEISSYFHYIPTKSKLREVDSFIKSQFYQEIMDELQSRAKDGEHFLKRLSFESKPVYYKSKPLNFLLGGTVYIAARCIPEFLLKAEQLCRQHSKSFWYSLEYQCREEGTFFILNYTQSLNFDGVL